MVKVCFYIAQCPVRWTAQVYSWMDWGDMERTIMAKLRNGTNMGFKPGLPWLWVRHSTTELPRSTGRLLQVIHEDVWTDKQWSLSMRRATSPTAAHHTDHLQSRLIRRLTRDQGLTTDRHTYRVILLGPWNSIQCTCEASNNIIFIWLLQSK